MINLSLEQQTAVDLCSDLHKRIVGVTGSAGTGKTLVLGEAYREIMKKDSVQLIAPTGRAAKRIQELTGIRAKTVHRFLEFPTPEDGDDAPMNEPQRNAFKKVEPRIVFCDESSMLSPTLFRQLMEALRNDGCIRFFGDNNQLAPVERGIPPFVDVLESQPSLTLTYNFRSGDEIVSNANRILQGRIPERNDRFALIYVNDPIRALYDHVDRSFMSIKNQIIMPMRNGKYGTGRVNPRLQLKLNGKSLPYLKLDRLDKETPLLTLRPHDKFIWVKNDYKLDMFNGEVGNVNWVDPEDGSFEVSTADRTLEVPPRVRAFNPQAGVVVEYDPRKQLELGYAITTHKSQGSEFETVIYCISSKNAFMLNRRNFYTAVTRAKKNVIVLLDRTAMRYSLRRYMM